MNIILFGPPSAGKGTQAKLLTKEYDLKHISTGDIFRYHISNETQIGKEVKNWIDQGKLVPDELTIKMVESALEEGFILDGFPRTLEQAKALTRILDEHNLTQAIVIRIVVDTDELVRRVTGRRICPKCSKSYHIEFTPPEKEGICDECGVALIHRKDDQEEVFMDRLNVYEKETMPCIEYYQEQKLVYTIDGNQSVQNIFNEIKDILDQS